MIAPPLTSTPARTLMPARTCTRPRVPRAPRAAVILALSLSLVLMVSQLMPSGAQAEELRAPRAAGTAPWLGMSVSGLRDYGTQRPFIDVMTSARAWIGHLPGQWGGWEEADLIAAGALGPHGWPLFVPDGLTGISTLLMVDLPEDAGGVAGRYRLTYEGRGRLRIDGRATSARRRAPGEIWFNFTPGSFGVQLTIRQTDPEDPIRNIRVVHEDHIEADARGELINPDWRARMDGLAVLRFMGWHDSNYATWSDWDRRPVPDDYSWTLRGVPLEILIRVANDMGVDPWFNIPHLADDTYITGMAEMIRDQLDPGLTAWIEFSNETWNWSFLAANAAADAAEARWGDRGLWQEWNAMRAAQMVQIFNRVFGDEAYRLKRVLGTQKGWLGLEQQLEAPRWQAEDPDNPAPPSLFDVYAITAYFGGILGSPERAPMLRAWLAEARQEATRLGMAQGLQDEALADFVRDTAHRLVEPLMTEEIMDGRHSGDRTDTILQIFTHYLPYHMAVAERWGLELVAYEGGTHVAGLDEIMDDPELTALFVDFNYSEGMAELYTHLLEGWYRMNTGIFVHHTDIGAPGRWGSYGALRHLSDHSPRWQALVGFDPQSVRP
ncbi:MAG: hypothetical protein ACXIU7_06225 [Roseinatronobacter sp.]